MKKISLKVVTLVAVLTVAGLAVADTNSNEATLNQIAGYRQWPQINPQPVIISLNDVAI